MEKIVHFKVSGCTGSAALRIFFILFCGLLLCNGVRANPNKVIKFNFNKRGDTVAEKKVDYIEKIYFSGGNKAQINASIASTLQDMQAKAATEAVTRQYVFLSGIQDQANDASNTCEVEEMLAGGIWDIDPIEADAQHIPKPGAKVGAKIDKALAGVNSVSNAAGGAAVSAFLLSNGSYKSYKTTSKVAGAAGSVGNMANSATQVKQTYDQTKKLFYNIFDKPCKKVTPKNIEIGTHVVSDATAAVDK